MKLNIASFIFLQIATLCKAQKILSGHPKTVEDKAVRPVIRALNAYKDHHSVSIYCHVFFVWCYSR